MERLKLNKTIYGATKAYDSLDEEFEEFVPKSYTLDDLFDMYNYFRRIPLSIDPWYNHSSNSTIMVVWSWLSTSQQGLGVAAELAFSSSGEGECTLAHKKVLK